MNEQVTMADAANQLAALMQKKTEKYNSIMEEIEEGTEAILNKDIKYNQAFDTIVSIEFLLVKLRLDVEFEHIQVKEALANKDTIQGLRSIFIKRDQLLANYIIKLNNIRDDISTLQKIVYTKSSFKF